MALEQSKLRTLEDWLDDLCARFIINLPAEDLSSMERICFHVEEAQWFYEDFIRPADPNLPTLTLRNFCAMIFKHCPLLADFPVEAHEKAFENFMQYKQRIPVRGAIMLNEAMDHVVLVKGWKKTASWSFPRGKINMDEDDLDCAIREVEEETGLELREAGLVPDDEAVKYIELNIREQAIRLYVFRNIPMDTTFEPKTRKEISKIEWFPLSELPTFRKKNNQLHDDPANSSVSAAVSSANNRFYIVAPFLGPLKKWVQKQKRMDARRQGTTTDMSHLIPSNIPEEAYAEGLETAHPYNHGDNNYSYGQQQQQQANLDDASHDLQRLMKLESSGNPTVHISAPVANSAEMSDRLMSMLKIGGVGGSPDSRGSQGSHQPQQSFGAQQQPQQHQQHQQHQNQQFQQHQLNQQHQSSTEYSHHGGTSHSNIEPSQPPLIKQTPPTQIHHPQPIPPQVQKANLDQGLLSYATPPPTNGKPQQQGPSYSLQTILAQTRLQQQQQQEYQRRAQQQAQEQSQQQAQDQSQQQQQHQHQQNLGQQQTHLGFPGHPDAQQQPQHQPMNGPGPYSQQHQTPELAIPQSHSQPQSVPGYQGEQYGSRPVSGQYNVNPPHSAHGSHVSGGNLSNHTKGLLGMFGSETSSGTQPIPIPAPQHQQATPETMPQRSWPNETPEQQLARTQALNGHGNINGNLDGTAHMVSQTSASQIGSHPSHMDPMAMHNGQAILNGMMQKTQQHGMSSDKQRSALLDMFKGGPSPSSSINEQQQPMTQPDSYRQSPMDGQSFAGPRHNGGGDSSVQNLHNAMGGLALQGGVRQSSSMSNPPYVRGTVSIESPMPLLQSNSISPSVGSQSRHSQTPYNFDRSTLESTGPNQSAMASPPIINGAAVPGGSKRAESTPEQKQRLLSLFSGQQQGHPQQSQQPQQSSGFHQQSSGQFHQQPQQHPMALHSRQQSSPQQHYAQVYGQQNHQQQHGHIQSHMQYSGSHQPQGQQPHPLSQSQVPGTEAVYFDKAKGPEVMQPRGASGGPGSAGSGPVHMHRQPHSQQPQQYNTTEAFHRLPSTASAMSDGSHPSNGGKNTPISPADRNFLLGYLQSAMTTTPAETSGAPNSGVGPAATQPAGSR
ncbi:mRNA decapping complex subunit 2 [Ceratocystis fimbriata CBS 114723]|uniref:mRNA decapping complex subunit 2 n=1 Tax=Ceratocystis fimbriata CBS 114723 TaxID=1035309 RepID=A0A2C5WX44_9PEZI|nr:mRNA decapping complex subunit 2 [Ceratocystis fimbriata CBS 114723]